MHAGETMHCKPCYNMHLIVQRRMFVYDGISRVPKRRAKTSYGLV